MHQPNERERFWITEAFRLAARDGWAPFGSHHDRFVELEFDGLDPGDGLPLWEREVKCDDN